MVKVEEQKMTLYEQLIHKVPLHEIDHYRSDLYVKVTYTATQVINGYFKECSENLKKSLISTFESRIPPHDKWYKISFAYDPFWEEGKNHNEN